jgi:hypothetical protein
MAFRAHGNWCGPGWSARQYKNAEDLTEEDKQVEAVDELDQVCKDHDIGIAEGDPEANSKFVENASKLGVKGAAFATLVAGFGPSLRNSLRGGQETNENMSKRRSKKEETFVAWKSSNSIRLKNKQNAQRETERQFLQDENRVYTADPNNELKRKAEEDLDDTSDRPLTRYQDEFPVDNFVTPDRPTMRQVPRLTRGERQPLSNLLDQVDNEKSTLLNMDSRDDEPMNTRTADGQVTRAGNRETLVMYNTPTEMGIFTETRTAYLPITVYFSINRTEIAQPVPLHIRLDWPFNIFTQNTLAQQSLRSLWSDVQIRNQGLSNDMAKSGNRGTTATGLVSAANIVNIVGASAVDVAFNKSQLYPFPTTVVGSVAAVQGTSTVGGKSSSGSILDASVVPAYRRWYAKMYQYAHCMETDYKITYFSGEQNEEFQNMRIYEGMDCVSAGNTDKIPVNCELGTVDHWPYLKKHDLTPRHESKARKDYVISGKWTPNMQFPMKMVANEEDIKTWTRLDATDFADRNPNSFREDLTLLHYSHPDSANIASFYNVRVDLRYKIQFKDLTNKLRWPKANDGDIALTSTDCHQIPYPTQQTGAGAQPERIYCDGVIPR